MNQNIRSGFVCLLLIVGYILVGINVVQGAILNEKWMIGIAFGAFVYLFGYFFLRVYRDQNMAQSVQN